MDKERFLNKLFKGKVFRYSWGEVEILYFQNTRNHQQRRNEGFEFLVLLDVVHYLGVKPMADLYDNISARVDVAGYIHKYTNVMAFPEFNESGLWKTK